MQKNKKSVFLRLMTYLKPHKGTLLAAMGLVLVVTASDLLRPILIGNAMDVITEGGVFSTILRYFVLYMGLVAVRYPLQCGSDVATAKNGSECGIPAAQGTLCPYPQPVPAVFDITPVGRIVTRVTNDVETLNELFSSILVTMVRNVVLIAGYAGVMLMLEWRLALLSFVLLPLVFYLTGLFTRLYRTTHRITRTKVSAMNTYLSENLSAMKLIQVFHREREKRQEFCQRSGDLFQSNFREIVVYGTFRPLIYWISIVSLALVLGFGGVQVMGGTHLYWYAVYFHQLCKVLF